MDSRAGPSARTALVDAGEDDAMILKARRAGACLSTIVTRRNIQDSRRDEAESGPSSSDAASGRADDRKLRLSKAYFYTRSYQARTAQKDLPFLCICLLFG